jgi:glutamate transport system substrate-binding protein
MLLFLVALFGACVPADDTIDLRRDYPENTTMGLIQASGEILIGVPENAPPLGALKVSGGAEGLGPELGSFVADTLGVEPRWISGTNSQLVELVEDGSLDLAFVTTPLTEETVKVHNFAGPYFIGHQRLLVRVGQERIRGPVCAAVNPDVGVDLTATRPALKVLSVPRVELCRRMLESGVASAATALDSSLVRLKLELGKRWKIAGDQLNTVGLGAVVPAGVPAYQRFVAAALGRAERDEVWSKAYARLLEPYLGPSDPPPLTVEEAAALHPTLLEKQEKG